MQQSLKKIPAIVTDIGGVLLRHKTAIPKVPDTVRLLKTKLKDLDPQQFPNDESRIPFLCLTNDGEHLEKVKAEFLNGVLGLEKENEKFTSDDVLVNFTALRPVMKDYQDRLVIVSGDGDMHKTAKECGLTKFITLEEYSCLHPNMVPVSKLAKSGSVEEMRKIIGERLNISDQSVFDKALQVHAIFILNDPPYWYEYTQIICDLLTTHNGNVAEKLPNQIPDQHIPIYTTNNDLVYPGPYHLPRFTLGAFTECLKHIYKQYFHKDLHVNLYGKPYETTFKYAEKYLHELANRELSNIYMIGDNPHGDVRGAKKLGWRTILVETGVFQKYDGIENDPTDPADYVVKDFNEAIKLIFSLEKINTKI